MELFKSFTSLLKHFTGLITALSGLSVVACWCLSAAFFVASILFAVFALSKMIQPSSTGKLATTNTQEENPNLDHSSGNGRRLVIVQVGKENQLSYAEGGIGKVAEGGKSFKVESENSEFILHILSNNYSWVEGNDQFIGFNNEEVRIQAKLGGKFDDVSTPIVCLGLASVKGGRELNEDLSSRRAKNLADLFMQCPKVSKVFRLDLGQCRGGASDAIDRPEQRPIIIATILKDIKEVVLCEDIQKALIVLHERHVFEVNPRRYSHFENCRLIEAMDRQPAGKAY